LEDAKYALERGEKQFPADENILYYLGFLYDRLGEKARGVATMERLLGLNPNNANALNFVGYSLVEKGERLDQAKILLERAMALKPGDAFVLDSYGWLLYRLGKNQESMRHLEKAMALKPDEGVIAEHLADVYAASGLPLKAMQTYAKALRAGGDREFTARVEYKRDNVAKTLADAKEKRVAPRAISSSASERTPASR
jgi:tetratricopeptide (TPR) repeat protein